MLLGVLTGAWAGFTDAGRWGLALATDRGHAVSAADVRAAATAFRYARGLVSAAEFTAWLRERDMTLSELSAALVRQLLRERADADTGERADDEALSAVLRVEALCRGILDALATAAIDRLAAADRLGERTPAPSSSDRVETALDAALSDTAAGLPMLGEAELRRRLQRLVALDEALEQLRREVATADAVRQCLATHRLDWLCLSGDELAVAELGAAREARMLVREDGLSLEAVAERAGATVCPRSVYLEDVPAAATTAFAAAAPGEVVGPWEQDGAWRVLVLTDKAPPTPTDENLVQRATDELLAAIVERHRAGRSERLCVL